MSKGLEALKEIKNKPFSWEKLKDNLDTIEKDLVDGEKNKQALEIIKDKKVNVSLLFNTQNYRDYNVQICYNTYYKQPNAKCLELEEYDLLKEVML